MTFCLLLYFLLHQGECTNLNKELYRQQRSSELTNQKLQKEFEDASSATKALETKIEVLMKLDNLSQSMILHHKSKHL